MKTICFFNSVSAWGGGEKWHLEMSYYLHQNKQYNVIVYCQQKGELYKKVVELGIQVRPISVGNLTFLDPVKLWRLTNQLRKDKPDLIVLNISKDIKSGALAAKYAGVKNIVYRRGSAIAIKNNFLNRWYFKNVITNILANSDETKKTINQKNPKLFPEDKIQVIYNGLHLDQYKSLPKQDKECFVIGNLGRLEYQKNQVALLELAKVLKQKINNFKIVIGGDGRLMNELKQKASELEIDDVVEFQGYIDDVNLFMSQLDVFLLTSHWEGFGYVLAEASYHEKPVLAYKVSSNPEIVKDRETGYLVEKDDIQALSEYILKLKENDNLRNKLGQNGKNFVLENFNAKVNQVKVEEYFMGLID